MNLLLRQVSLVLVVDSQFLEANDLVALDAFNLDALILKSLSDLAAFLKVVKSVLFFTIVVLSDLIPYGGCMTLEGFLFLSLDSLLVLLLFLLSRDHLEESIALTLGLFCIHGFFLHELLLTGLLKFCGQYLSPQYLVFF